MFRNLKDNNLDLSTQCSSQLRIELSVEAEAVERVNIEDLVAIARKQHKDHLARSELLIAVSLRVTQINENYFSTVKVLELIQKYRNFTSLIIDRQ